MKHSCGQTYAARNAIEYPATQRMTVQDLAQQNQRFQGTGGISQENHQVGFVPAFLDTSTGRVYLSRFPDGKPAPFHLLDGLPSNLVTKRAPSGEVTAVLRSITAGFVRDGQFYTRQQATKAVSDHAC